VTLLAYLIVSKYMDHQPLNRLRKIIGRRGVAIPVSTLAGWIAHCARVLESIAKRIGELALLAYLLQGDDTGLIVLDRDAPDGRKRGHMWSYLGDRRWAYFEYTPTREASGPYRYLKLRRG
jgi:transposase